MIKQSQVAEWFPEEDLLVVPTSVLPPGIDHQPTRQMLTEVGLPEALVGVVELDTQITKHIRTAAEVYHGHDEEPPADTRELFFLGFAGQPFLCVDGYAGTVLQVHQQFGSRPLASGLEAFIRVLGFVSISIDNFQRNGRKQPQFATRLYESTMKQLKKVDPKAATEAEPAWRDLLNDIAAAVA